MYPVRARHNTQEKLPRPAHASDLLPCRPRRTGLIHELPQGKTSSISKELGYNCLFCHPGHTICLMFNQTNPSNPLIPQILELLRQHPLGMSEYEMMQRLGGHVGFDHIGDKGQLPLFQKHFLIMNGLYQLQQSLWEEERLALYISPLRIALTTSDTAGNGDTHPVISDCAKLSIYYLDWRNLEETTESDITELHRRFWERFSSHDGRGDALATLGLGEDASAETINSCYRKLAAKHHPDRGGCSERFIEIRRAYELLKRF